MGEIVVTVVLDSAVASEHEAIRDARNAVSGVRNFQYTVPRARNETSTISFRTEQEQAEDFLISLAAALLAHNITIVDTELA